MNDKDSGSLPAACEVAVPTRRKKTRGPRNRAASRRPRRLVVPRGARESRVATGRARSRRDEAQTTPLGF